MPSVLRQKMSTRLDPSHVGPDDQASDSSFTPATTHPVQVVDWPSFVWNGSSAPDTCTRSTSWSSPDARRTESKKLRSASQSSGDSHFIVGQPSMNSFFRPGVTKRVRRMRPKNIRTVCVPRDSPPPALSSWIRQTAALNETVASWCPK